MGEPFATYRMRTEPKPKLPEQPKNYQQAVKEAALEYLKAPDAIRINVMAKWVLWIENKFSRNDGLKIISDIREESGV